MRPKIPGLTRKNDFFKTIDQEDGKSQNQEPQPGTSPGRFLAPGRKIRFQSTSTYNSHANGTGAINAKYSLQA